MLIRKSRWRCGSIVPLRHEKRGRGETLSELERILNFAKESEMSGIPNDAQRNVLDSFE
jgi:hypothetical protein